MVETHLVTVFRWDAIQRLALVDHLGPHNSLQIVDPHSVVQSSYHFVSFVLFHRAFALLMVQLYIIFGIVEKNKKEQTN